jgi:hypothetical protein
MGPALSDRRKPPGIHARADGLGCRWLWLVLAAFMPWLSGCQPADLQKEVKLLERWGNRWCADATHERLDQCEYSDGLNRLVGAVAALGSGQDRPPMQISAGDATQACLDGDPAMIVDLNAYLSRGARVVVRGEQLQRYDVRTAPQPGQPGYHRVHCHFRPVILEGPASLLEQRF